jgi:hypothetical protein
MPGSLAGHDGGSAKMTTPPPALGEAEQRSLEEKFDP